MLEEYKSFFASVAGILTIGQMCSGLFMCKDIYKAGSTKNFPVTPFVGGFVISILFNQHARLLQDDAIGFVNTFGISLNIFYLVFFILWSESAERNNALKQLFIGLGVVAVLIGYVQIEDPTVVQLRFGSIVTGALMLLIAAPLFNIKTIIRTRNTSEIPFPMTVGGIAMSTAWALYGISANQPFVVYQNLIGLALTIPQLILCLMYPTTRVEKKKSS